MYGPRLTDRDWKTLGVIFVTGLITIGLTIIAAIGGIGYVLYRGAISIF